MIRERWRRMAAHVLLVGLATTASLAQEPARRPEAGPQGQPEIEVYLDRSQRPRLRLGMPAPEGLDALTGEAAAAARELERTLRADLEDSGVFILQGPDQFSILRLSGDQERDFEQYRSLGNEILLESQIGLDGERLVLEGRLFELANRRNLLGKRYRGGFHLARRIAHTFADDLVQFFTGRKGLALTSIVFQSDRGGRGIREVFLMDYDGQNQRPLTAHQTLSISPEFDPRGEAVAYVSYVAGLPGIYLVDLRSGRKTSVVTEGELNISPAFSPDGRRIALSRSLAGNTEIFVCNRDGSDLRRLTHARAIDTNPAWSPTGREIAFTSSRAGSPQIYVMSAEGTDLRRVTFEGEYNDGAAWSPDGTRIAHASRRGNRFDLALTDLVTLESRSLPAGEGSHETPTFSPDGRKIAFASRRAGSGTQIYVMDLDGSKVRRLTGEGNNAAPSWSRNPE